MSRPKPGLRPVCRWVVRVFAVLYLLALLLLAIGTFGLFGQPRDPLAGVFVIILGQPWTGMLSDALGGGGMAVALAAPAINLALLWIMCRVLARLRRPPS